MNSSHGGGKREAALLWKLMRRCALLGSNVRNETRRLAMDLRGDGVSVLDIARTRRTIAEPDAALVEAETAVAREGKS